MAGFVSRTRGRVKFPVILTDLGSSNKGLYDSLSGVKAATVWTNAGAPTNGTSGTLAGFAQPGDLLVDVTNKTIYQNTNTALSPTYTQITAAGGATASLILTGYLQKSVGNALTAVGTNRATALQLAKQVNNVTTAATGTGVILPVGAVGMEITVYADSGMAAAAIQVYATASETIDTVAGATGVVLTKAKRCIYTFVAANTWISAQLGVISA